MKMFVFVIIILEVRAIQVFIIIVAILMAKEHTDFILIIEE